MGEKKQISRQAVMTYDPVGTTYDLGSSEIAVLVDLLYQGSVDAYCVECHQKSIFRNPYAGYLGKEEAEKLPKYGLITARARCQRNVSEPSDSQCQGELVVLLRRNGSSLTKLAQYPPKADLDFGELDPAMRELPERSRKELRRAIGLRSHAIGVGSFVYLRRIFERLIDEAYEAARNNAGWDDDAFKKSRVNEKIKLLEGYLPSRLVKSADLYGVLSKGIHELEEDECLSVFDLVFQAIKLIVSEHHENKQYAKTISAISKAAQSSREN